MSRPGTLAEAIPLYQDTLAARERVLGEEHPISRTVRINLVRRLHKTQRRTNPERRVTAAPGRHGDHASR